MQQVNKRAQGYTQAETFLRQRRLHKLLEQKISYY